MKYAPALRMFQYIVLSLVVGGAVTYFGIRKRPQWIDPPEIVELLERGATFVDLRTPSVVNVRALPNAIHIPRRELAARMAELPRDRPLIVYGSFGDDSEAGYLALVRAGFEVYDLGPMNRYPRRLRLPAQYVPSAHGHAGHSHGAH